MIHNSPACSRKKLALQIVIGLASYRFVPLPLQCDAVAPLRFRLSAIK
jgi:hypothetical protein